MSRRLGAAMAPFLLLVAACDAGGDSAGEPTDGGSGGSSSGGASSGGASSSGGSAGWATGGAAGMATGGGGSAGGSGTAGSGGSSSSGGTPSTGEYGFFPATVTAEDAQAVFDTWKAAYTESCGENGIRVRADNAAETVSEGIGYGALLTVAWDDHATFDGIWTYYRKAAAASDAQKGVTHQLMGWKVVSDACAPNVADPGAASDADLDMAMALLQAECRWGGGGYLSGATTIIASIKAHMTSQVASGIALLPGDNWGGPTPCMNPSYFSPGYYRVFARAVPADAAHWNAMAEDTYTFLGLVSHASSGLPVDWASNGSGGCGNATSWYGYDAARTPWRIATDYAWFGTPAAKTWLDKITLWLEGSVGAAGLADVKDGFNNDGSGVLGPAGMANSTFVGAFASGALATSQATSDAFHQAFLAIPSGNDNSYFKLTTRALYLLLATRSFSAGCY
jgi:endoglucanase